MPLTKEQQDFYKKTLEETKKQLESIDDQIEKELQKVRERLVELQETKKSLRLILVGAAKMLGIEVELEEEKSSEISPS